MEVNILRKIKTNFTVLLHKILTSLCHNSSRLIDMRCCSDLIEIKLCNKLQVRHPKTISILRMYHDIREMIWRNLSYLDEK